MIVMQYMSTVLFTDLYTVHVFIVGFARRTGGQCVRVRSRRSSALLRILRVPRARDRALVGRAPVAGRPLAARPHP